MPLLDTKTVGVATVVTPTEPPAVPVLASPPNGATGVTIPVALTWNPATGAASYRVQVAMDNAFNNIAFDQAGITTTSVSVAGLQANTQYFWRVNATNPVGTSGWSTVFSFTTGAVPVDIWGPLMAMLLMVMMMGMMSQIAEEGGMV